MKSRRIYIQKLGAGSKYDSSKSNETTWKDMVYEKEGFSAV